MKIIQSFWTGTNKNLDFSFGWLSSKYNFLSWILSSNQLKKYYDEVELFTDEFGYKILIEKLKLPYTKVHIVLDELNEYDDNLWALAKIKAYNLMNEPFLHVDGDVFIFEPFDNELMSQPIIIQNIETTSEYYWNMWMNIKPKLTFVPNTMMNYDQKIHNKAFNMGIFGGNNMAFIKKYSIASFDFVNKNKHNLSNINAYNFNIFFEQVLLYELSIEDNIKVDCLINEDIGDNEYKGFGNFEEVPDERKYLHLLGFYKKQELICNKMDVYVQKYYPHYYYNLELLLELNPKLSSFGFSYRNKDLNILTNEYLKFVILNETSKLDNTQKIFCRNVLSEGLVKTFLSKIENKKDFYLIPLTNYTVDNEYSELIVELLYDKTFKITLLSIDYVIFKSIKTSIKYTDFVKTSKEYVDEDFPKEELDNFIELLWKRISIFISYGIFYPLDINKYNKIIV